jgi:predicted 3-demethylubiquinone-9 3-methyltransferase (glyoxalase superfamily)
MKKITPFLWFDNQAEEAANFYVAVFSARHGNSKINNITRYDAAGSEASGRPAGSVMTVEFLVAGQEFVALNGGSHFQFSGAISFVVNCETQEEIDYFWEALSSGGEKGQCGWINRDKFGVTWQIVPAALGKMLSDKDPEKSQRVMKAMLKMNKLDVKALREAYEQEA